MLKRIALLTIAALVTTLTPAAAQTAGHASENFTVTNPNDGTKIAITVFRPAGASAGSQVPIVFSSHGWGGSRWTQVSQAKPFLDAGFGVVSIDQRGHGQSSGQAYTQDPTRETEDIKAVIDFTAMRDWVRLDGPGDPVLGAVGGSYGGGYQTMTALDEIAETGRTRFNALAPEMTWYDLPQSLAPNTVPRSLWNLLLYGVGARMVPEDVHRGFAWGTATGSWPDGTFMGTPAPGIPNLDTRFHRNSPISFVEEGHQINVPVFLRQGATDSLFPMNEGLKIFDLAVSDDAREESYFTSAIGGHVLPQVYPQGASPAPTIGGFTDPCSTEYGGFTNLTIQFFSRVFSGQSTDGLLPNQYSFSDVDAKACIRGDYVDGSRKLTVAPLAAGQTVSTTGAGAPLQLPVAAGPITVTGIPELTGRVTSLGVDSRMFVGLSMGNSAQNARLIDNNVMPLREIQPAIDKRFALELAGVGVHVPAGQNLYLTITPVADAFGFHGTRGTGAMSFNGLSLSLPQPGFESAEQLASSLTLAIEGKGSKAQLVATLTDAASAAPISGAAIDFLGDGEALGTGVTDESGVARLDLPPQYQGGHHYFEANFGGNDQYTGSSASTDS